MIDDAQPACFRIGLVLALIAGWVVFPRALYVSSSSRLNFATRHTRRNPESRNAAQMPCLSR